MEQPDVRPIGESGDIYMVYTPYPFYLSKGNADIMFVVPSGYKYDGASVPRFLWTSLGILPDGVQRAGALVHDYLYQHKGNLDGFKFSRKFADHTLRKMIDEAGLKSWHAWLVYMAVRAFGWIKWR